MGKAVIHAGGAGAGQAAKICNNMLLGATMVATCEAFVLAEKLGLDPQTFYDIASKASGQSWSMTSYCPVPGVGPDTPGRPRLRGRVRRRADAQGPQAGDGSRAGSRRLHADGRRSARNSTSASSIWAAATKDFSGIIKMIDDSWTPPADK